MHHRGQPEPGGGSRTLPYYFDPTGTTRNKSNPPNVSRTVFRHARVRVQPFHRPPAQVVGVLVAVDSVGLTLKASDGSPQVIPLDEIVRLERYDGRLASYTGSGAVRDGER